MDKNKFNFRGENFAESVKEHYIKQEDAEKKRKQYRYWIFAIGILGIFYFLMTSIKIPQHNKFISKNDIEKFVNKTKSNFVKADNCSKCFSQLNENNFLGKHSNFRVNIKELCKWDDQNITIETPEFPVSVIFKATNNLVIFETELNLIYHPKHFYCIIIDDKNISDVIRKYILRMSQCLPNIFVTNKRDNIRGHGLECLDILIHYKWNYTIIFNENDIPIKSIKEIIKDLKLLNGTSDVPIYSIYSKNILASQQNTYSTIGIFKDKNILINNNYIRDKELMIARTIVSITLSRDDVDYYYNYLDNDNYIKFINLNSIIRKNNVFWPTLLANKELNFPSHNIKLQNSPFINIGFLSFMKNKTY
ncbi:Glycosyl transferase, family 14-containing protein [Strongyloides ratti]|uniref:Glycosyl transferase, family 14-containing protein n=1 Tax=Strongyloides ratti TaxID=34506 RepID=A0A090LK64_STRRB|nr:Glycosyl transferase, family 14-containing protein [Strongyloides ratti]CEF70177.1 Glycosyl transferase, family 14-containing protein [Strongyloides ratti]